MSYPADSPSLPASPEPSGQELRSTQPLDDWRSSITTFAGFTGTRPSAEHLNISFGEATKIFCPKEAVVLADKAQGTYFISCELQDAELVGTTREWAIKNGQPTVGKMRAKPHVTASTLVVVDVDGMQMAGFNASLQMLEEQDITHLAYTTHSHGREDKPGVRARIVIPVDRALTPDEYTIAWFGFDQFFLGGQAGKADPSGARLHQQQGIHCCHPDRTDQAVIWMHVGGVASAEALLEIGRQVDRVKLITAGPTTEHAAQTQYAEVDYPYSDADKIARNCQQIQQMRDTKGADQNEPLWNASIGAVVHCHNGYQKIHDWSSGHAGYSVVATDKKIAHREKIPPSTCHQFRQINPEGCEGCNRECGSPFSLGFDDTFEVVDGCEVKERIHDLRHSAASFLINSNHSLYVVQKFLGHTQIKTSARYSHLAPETMLNAADAMANAAGLGIAPPPAPEPVVPAPVASVPPVEPSVTPAPATLNLRLVGKDDTSELGLEKAA
jgi:hypothetical protein